MLVFNEGVPRAGKSFDGVRTHILAGLKKGRKVYARLNGLDHSKIAAYLGMPLDQVQQLLVLVDSGQVRTFFTAQQDASGQWFIPDHLKDALFVIDECHEFYVSTRDALPPEIEQFFALHGQNGMDGLLLSQWYKRLHVAIRARVERKNVFQKLTAAGMKGHYRVNFFQTVAPDKFETTGGENRKYDPAIFPLYAGYAPGADNDAVYDEGGRTVWAALRGRAFFIVPVACVAVWYLVSFFTGGAQFTKSARAAQETKVSAQHVDQVSQGAVRAVATVAPTPPKPKMSAAQKYVDALGEKGRIRLAALIKSEGGYLALVEWVDPSGNAIERLTSVQLAALGCTLRFEPFGVQVEVPGNTMIATAWPLNLPLREEQPRLYNLSPEDRAQPTGVPSVSEPRPSASTVNPNIGTDYAFPNP